MQPVDINYELYKVFYYVGKTLSFSEASRSLYISQSAVSQSIKTLEKKLGQKLFVRSTKKVMLTKEGELLYKHIESAVNLIIHGEAQIYNSGNPDGGQIRIAASDTICRYYLVPYLNKFHEAYPKVQISVKNGTSARCAQYLSSNEVDLIITNYPNAKLPADSAVVDIMEFTDEFVASESAYNVFDKKLTYEELKELPLMMLDRSTATSTFLHDIFLKKGIDLVPEIEISSNDLLIDLAKIGLGIAFVPDYCLDPMPDGLKKISLEESITPRKLVAAYSQSVPVAGVAKYFLDILLEGKK